MWLFNNSVANPDPESGIRCLFDPWIRDGEKIRIRDPGCSFDVDPTPGTAIFLTLDQGWKIRIRDKYPGSATLFNNIFFSELYGRI